MKIKLPLIALLILAIVGCATKEDTSVYATQKVNGKIPVHTTKDAGNYYRLSKRAADPEYGKLPSKAINVGRGVNGGPVNQHLYLRSLAGPEGEPIEYRRLGSCCAFEDENLPFGGGLLDKYEVRYEGLDSPIILYLNMYYEDEELLIPDSFSGR